jgi:hypothetical protein
MRSDFHRLMRVCLHVLNDSRVVGVSLCELGKNERLSTLSASACFPRCFVATGYIRCADRARMELVRV